MNWRRRWLLILVAGLLIGLAIARLLCWQGLVLPIRIASGSMVPTLRGAHVDIVCHDCGFSFPCDATSPPETGQAVCPNCGFPANPLIGRPVRLGQRVVIDRWPYLWRSPRRWELVAFKDPLAPTTRAVKRVIGLPGETVAIRQGDLFIDGRIARKPIDVQRSMAVLVHDDDFRPTRTKSLPRRWDAAQEPSGWERRARGYHFQPADDQGQLAWLTFRGWRCFGSPLERSEETAVLDHYGYNQNTSRELHPVADLTLACRLRWLTPGQVRLRVTDGRDTFEVELDRRQAATLRREDVVIGTYRCPPLQCSDLEFGICDRQVFLAVGRRIVFRVAFDASRRARRPTARPLGIAARRAHVLVDHLRVYRDVYYLDPYQLARDWTIRSPPDRGEILVLGDNVPISRDSRHWPSAGLSPKSLVGRVLASE